jgi:hypothetical protein
LTAPAPPPAGPAWTGERLEAAAAIWKSRSAVLPAAFGGVSMRPTIQPGEQVRVLCGTEPVVGEVCAFVRAGRLFVHRVVAASSDGAWLLTRGDANLLPDAPIRRHEVLGRVVAFDGGTIAAAVGRFPVVRRVVLRASDVALSAGPRLATLFLSALWAMQRRVFSLRRGLGSRGSPAAGEKQGSQAGEVGGQRCPVDHRRQRDVNEAEEVVILERPRGGEPDEKKRRDQ